MLLVSSYYNTETNSNQTVWQNKTPRLCERGGMSLVRGNVVVSATTQVFSAVRLRHLFYGVVQVVLVVALDSTYADECSRD